MEFFFFFLRNDNEIIIEGTKTEKLRKKLDGTEKKTQMANQVLDNVVEILDKNRKKRNADELIERNAIISGCTNNNSSDELFLYLGVSNGSQISKHKVNRSEYLDEEHEKKQLTSLNVYAQNAYYTPAVYKIIRNHYESDQVAYVDITGRKIRRKGDNGELIPYFRKWMIPCNRKENHKLFVESSGGKILEHVSKVPCAKFLESFKPFNYFYFKCSQYGACDFCLLALKNYFIFADLINNDCLCKDKIPERASLFVADSICKDSENFIMCIENKCKTCRIENFFTLEHYLSKKIDLDPNDDIFIYDFQMKKNSQSSHRSHSELIKQKLTLGSFFPKLQKFMAKYKTHHLRLKYQNEEVTKLIDPDIFVPSDTLVIFADYTENVAQKSATTDGVQNQWRSRLNFSLLNLVFFYCYKKNDQFKKVRFDMHFMSSDLSKDNLLFQKSLKLALEKLFDPSDLFFIPSEQIKNIIIGSDTCAGEFKSVTNLYRLLIKGKEIKINFLFITFVPKHGKFLYDLAGYLWVQIYMTECVYSLKLNDSILANLENIKNWMNKNYAEKRDPASRLEKRFTMIVDPIADHYESPYQSNHFFQIFFFKMH